MWEKLFKIKTDILYIQMFRYTFVGGIAFLFDFSSLYILTEYLNLHYLVSAAIASLMGLSINYSLCVLWVFEKRAIKSMHVEFVVFAFIGIVGLVLNELFIWFFTEVTCLHYLVSKSISTMIIFSWNFLAKKFTLFR